MSDAVHTALYDLHCELGAKMVSFAGYALPVHYPMGVLKEHLHTRTGAGLFDVSHMGQLRLSGPACDLALEALVPADLHGLSLYQQRYALLTNEDGGILDDLMVTRLDDGFLLIVNAACKAADELHLRRHLPPHCTLQTATDQALLALQGPLAHAVMARLAPAINWSELQFMHGIPARLAGIEALITRSGYTGEDGFEISLANRHAEALARILLEDDRVAPIGLGARDSLRLEAGLCLYGHDLDPHTTPVEASLSWAISAARRAGGARAGGFLGAQTILAQLKAGAPRKRVGLLPSERTPVREGAVLLDRTGRRIGQVTSGGFGPSLNGPLAMGFVEHQHSALGEEVVSVIREREVTLKVVPMPFVPQRYFRGTASALHPAAAPQP